MHLLQILNVSYNQHGRDLLQPISFSLSKGARLAIAGATGSGKTTLLKLIAGLLQPTKGSVVFAGEKVLGPEEKLLPGHHAIAYLSQHFELRNNYYVYELLEMSNKDEQAYARDIYRICKIDHLLRRRTNQLSGGERQRISLAALLTARPQVLLLDEPFSNADMPHRALLKEVLDDVNHQLHIAIILVAHEPVDVLPWADELMILNEGMLVQKGKPVDIYYHPVNKYAASLTGYYNILTPQLAKSFDITGVTSDDIITRPEQFILNTEGDGFAAVIQSILFMGHYFMMTVLVKDHLLKVISAKNNWRTGQKVYVSFIG